MNNIVDKLAFRYRNNNIAKIFVRPFYRLKRKIEEAQRRKMYHMNANSLLIRLKEVLDSNGIFFWLEFGTLLGAYREHDFIKHDLDLDIGVFFDNPQLVRKVLEKGGFKLIKEYRVGDEGLLGFEETYSYKDVTIDIFYFHKVRDVMYCNTFSPFEDEYKDMTIFQVKQITVPYTGFSILEFKGMNFNVPYDIPKHLTAHYGKNFMIPNAKFNYKEEATNIYWFKREERIGTLKKFV